MEGVNRMRLAIASRLLAGLLSNPNVVAYNATHGWGLINVSDATIAGYAVHLADKLIAANKSIKET